MIPLIHRPSRKGSPGNNKFGARGTLKCLNCRNRKARVFSPFSSTLSDSLLVWIRDKRWWLPMVCPEGSNLWRKTPWRETSNPRTPETLGNRKCSLEYYRCKIGTRISSFDTLGNIRNGTRSTNSGRWWPTKWDYVSWWYTTHFCTLSYI